MRHIRMVFFLALVCIYSCAPVQNSRNTTNPPIDFSSLDSVALSYVDSLKNSALSIGIVYNNQIVYTKGFGLADKKNKVPATSKTVYQVGSITKTFVGNLYARLAVSDQLNLSDKVNDYLQGARFPADSLGQEIAIINLLSHTAGLPPYPENLNRTDGEPISGYSSQQLLQAIATTKLQGQVGRKWSYSNFGYGVLGSYLETRFNKSLGQLLREKIFRPLRMNASTLSLSEVNTKQLAIPYTEGDAYTATRPWNMEALSGAGNMFSTVEDVSRFLLYQMAADTAARLQQTGVINSSAAVKYGLGCFLGYSPAKQSRTIFHGGDMDGYITDFAIYPDYKLGYIIMTNHGRNSEFRKASQAINATISRIIADYKARNR
ncbi:MAG TPA: serine hydrolase domain-containing protein [Chitinophagaceae bacterium]|nr:serine hydrolase domain-containing protein [Chitinophagaceae bacterium]